MELEHNDIFKKTSIAEVEEETPTEEAGAIVELVGYSKKIQKKVSQLPEIKSRGRPLQTETEILVSIPGVGNLPAKVNLATAIPVVQVSSGAVEKVVAQQPKPKLVAKRINLLSIK